MTAESTPLTHRVLAALVAFVALGLVLRLKFVDLLTKTTGTWVGGVESPHRDGARADTLSKSPSAG